MSKLALTLAEMDFKMQYVTPQLVNTDGHMV